MNYWLRWDPHIECAVVNERIHVRFRHVRYDIQRKYEEMTS